MKWIKEKTKIEKLKNKYIKTKSINKSTMSK